MKTILFVHGTGVRSKREREALDRIGDGFRKVLPDTVVEACSWGDVLGVAPADGTDAPDGAGPAWSPDGSGVTWSDAERAVWARLYDDPLYEIRTAILGAPGDASATSPRALNLLRGRVRDLADDPDVGELIPDGEPREQFREAVAELLRAQEFAATLPFLTARASHDLVARSVTSAYRDSFAVHRASARW